MLAISVILEQSQHVTVLKYALLAITALQQQPCQLDVPRVSIMAEQELLTKLSAGHVPLETTVLSMIVLRGRVQKVTSAPL